jgi:hypothetical protein
MGFADRISLAPVLIVGVRLHKVRKHLLTLAFATVAALASSQSASAAAWASVNGQVLDYTLPFNEPFVDARHRNLQGLSSQRQCPG